MKSQEFRQFLSHLCDIYLSAYQNLPKYAYWHRSDVKNYLKWLYNGDPNGFFIAQLPERRGGSPLVSSAQLKEAETIAGFISCFSRWYDSSEGLVGEIHELAVVPEFQNQGIGKGLLRKGIEYLEKEGRNKITLWVGDENEKAIKIYQDLGFVDLGQWGKWVRMILYL